MGVRRNADAGGDGETHTRSLHLVWKLFSVKQEAAREVEESQGQLDMGHLH